MMSATNLFSRGAAFAGALLLTGMTLILSDTLLTYPQGGPNFAPPMLDVGIGQDGCRSGLGDAVQPLPCA